MTTKTEHLIPLNTSANKRKRRRRFDSDYKRKSRRKRIKKEKVVNNETVNNMHTIVDNKEVETKGFTKIPIEENKNKPLTDAEVTEWVQRWQKGERYSPVPIAMSGNLYNRRTGKLQLGTITTINGRSKVVWSNP